MKGWILIQKGRPIFMGNNSIEVFRTKQDLYDYYNGALGDNNSIIKVKIEVEK
jgi:hypothetical protein